MHDLDRRAFHQPHLQQPPLDLVAGQPAAGVAQAHLGDDAGKALATGRQRRGRLDGLAAGEDGQIEFTRYAHGLTF